MKPNTDYSLRVPKMSELREAFGSLARCMEITGGYLPAVNFYLHNQDMIDLAPSVPRQPCDFTNDLHQAVMQDQVEAAWLAAEKPTIKAVSETVGVCRSVARRLLVSAGKWPKVEA